MIWIKIRHKISQQLAVFPFPTNQNENHTEQLDAKALIQNHNSSKVKLNVWDWSPINPTKVIFGILV